MIDPKYSSWIAEHYPTGDAACSQCAEATLALCAAFPELKRVRGNYYCAVWGQRDHWWCVTPDGQTVDPTAAQFPSRGKGVYMPHVEGEAEPTGKCPECGGYCFDGNSVCSEACHQRYRAYLMGGAL